MITRRLLESARTIPRPSEGAAKAFAERADAMAAAVSARMLARGDIHDLVGPDSLGLLLETHRNHVRFVAALLEEFDASVLVRTVSWVLHTYRAHGFKPQYWRHQLESWMAVLRVHLPEHAQEEIMEIYEWMEEHLEDFILISDRKLSGN